MEKKILTVTLNPAIDYTIDIPGFTIDSVNRVQYSRRDPGGKGINVATALSQSGFETHVTGFLGQLNKGIFTEHFKKSCITDDFVYVDGLTREGIKIADSKHSLTTDINFPGFKIKEGEILRFKNRFRDIISQFDYVVLSGSLPVGVPEDIYCELAKIAHEFNVFVAVDTSGRALRNCMESGFVDLVKPNIIELAEVYPDLDISNKNNDSLHLFIIGLLDKVGMIALSLGENGSQLYSRNKKYDVTAPKIAVKSTVGAGDTFLAGFIAGLATDLNEIESLRNAGSWAASTLTMYGAGLSEKDPPNKFMNCIKITEYHMNI